MNGVRHLSQTLQSILAQSLSQFDLIVSDDRSDDETLELVRQVCGDRARIVVNSERLGLAGNWNQCIALIDTPFVAIIHQDDVLQPGHLRLHLKAFETYEDVGLVASAAAVIDDAGKEVPPSIVGRGGLGPIEHKFRPGEALAKMAVGNPFRCSAVSLRAAAHARAGRFNPDLRYAVDWDHWLKIATDWSIHWSAETSVDIRWHPASETHRFKSGITDLEESEAVLKRLLTHLESFGAISSTVRNQARRGLSRAYLNRAHDMLRRGDGWSSRQCLKKSLHLSPAIRGTILRDPRLAAQMASVLAAPHLSGHLFKRVSPLSELAR